MSQFRSLLLVIAGSTQRELARQVRYLKVENEVLRSKLPARITITLKERPRLVKFGAKLGRALHQLMTIVTPGTFLRWIREDKRAGRKRTSGSPLSDSANFRQQRSLSNRRGARRGLHRCKFIVVDVASFTVLLRVQLSRLPATRRGLGAPDFLHRTCRRLAWRELAHKTTGGRDNQHGGWPAQTCQGIFSPL
jgi:hypothetical protein